MLLVSDKYKKQITENGREFRTSVKVGTKTYTDEEIISFNLVEETAENNTLSVGSVISNSFIMELKTADKEFERLKVEPYIGLKLSDGTYEDIPLGKFKVLKGFTKKGITKLECFDGMLDLERAFFPASDTATVGQFLNQISSSSGVTIIAHPPSTVVTLPVGLTMRQAISYLAGFMGCIAKFDREGKLVFQLYEGNVEEITDVSNIDYTSYDFKIIDPSQYASLTVADSSFRVGKVTGQVGEEVVTVGGAGNEVQINCPFMTRSRLESIYDNLKAISYVPFSTDRFKGDPAIQAGDKVLVIDAEGNQYINQVMLNRLSYRGGITQNISSVGATRAQQEFKPNLEKNQLIKKIAAELIHVKDLLAETIKVDDLTAWTARIDDLYAIKANISLLESDYAKIVDMEAKYATIENLNALNASVESLNTVYVTINQLDAVSGHISNLQSGQATINNLLAGNLEAKNMKAGFITTESGLIANAAITNAMIDTASANRLMIDQANIKSGAILDAFIKNLSADKITTGFLASGRIATGSITVEKLESGIGKKLGIVSSEEINLEIKDAIDNIKTGGTNLVKENLIKTGRFVQFDIELEDNREYAISFDISTENETGLMVYTLGGVEIVGGAKDKVSTGRYHFSTTAKKVSEESTRLIFFGTASDITVSRLQIQLGNVATDYLDFVETNKVLAAINLSKEGIRIDGKKLIINSDTEIGNAVIKTGHIEDLSVNTAKIANGSITNAKLGNASVDTAQIADLSVTTAKIAVAAVTTTQIANASITDAKIVELNANKITAGTLSVERLVIRGIEKSIVYELNNITGALQSQNVDTINGEVLTERTVTADRIVAKAITAEEIASRSITANEMVLNTITAQSGIIADLAITNAKIANAAISNAKIDRVSADRLVVDYGDIKDAAIKTAKIDDLAVTDAKIANIRSNKIIADWIESGEIKTGSLHVNVIKADSWNSLDLSSNTSINLSVREALDNQVVNFNNLVNGDITETGLIVKVINLQDVLSAGEYTISFDVKGELDSEESILMYSVGKWDIGKFVSKVKGYNQRYSLRCTVELGDENATETWLIVNGTPAMQNVTVSRLSVVKGLTANTGYVDFVETDKVLAAINLSKETITIDGKWLNINAQTTIEDASIAMAKIKDLRIGTNHITEEGISAHVIKSGFLDSERIMAGSITTNHLSSEVGANLDLSSNTSINLSLKPSKNLLPNGCFETGDIRTSGWTADDYELIKWYGSQLIPSSVNLRSYGNTNPPRLKSPVFRLDGNKKYRFSFMGAWFSNIKPTRIRVRFYRVGDDGTLTIHYAGSSLSNGLAQRRCDYAAFNKNLVSGLYQIHIWVVHDSDPGATSSALIWNLQLEEGEEYTDYERNFIVNSDSENIISSINLTPQGVNIAGNKINITGETHISSGVIKTAHISDGTITTAKIADASITSAKIVSLEADKIKAGVLKSQNEYAKWDLNTGVFTIKKAVFQSSVGSSQKVIIEDGKLTCIGTRYESTIYDGKWTITDKDNAGDAYKSLTVLPTTNFSYTWTSNDGAVTIPSFSGRGNLTWRDTSSVIEARCKIATFSKRVYMSGFSYGSNVRFDIDFPSSLPDIRNLDYFDVRCVSHKELNVSVREWIWRAQNLTGINAEVTANYGSMSGGSFPAGYVTFLFLMIGTY